MGAPESRPPRALRARAASACAALLALAVVPVQRAGADEPLAPGGHRIPPAGYLAYVPLESLRVVRATAESELVQLYGDRASPAYVDETPKDGIDDARGKLLLALAVRFSPYLVRNTTSIPMDWKRFATRTRSFPLHVDRWELSTSPEQLVRREQIDLDALRARPCPRSDPDAAPLLDDCALVRLLQELDPDAPRDERARTLADGARRSPFTVLYLDFPGDDPESWKAEYEADFGGQLRREYQGFKKAYVHPFVVAAARGGLELVLQYWLFYPFNDGANKHEGDWEHVNVVVSPRSRVGQPLSAADLGAILSRDPHGLDGDDPLVIARIENFLHGKVFVLDFTAPNVYSPRAAWEAQIASHPPDRLGERELLRDVRARAYADREERVVNTHPIAFIGADSKGPELLLAGPGARNRDSHATYPFHGTYTEVGPGGATEDIPSTFDLWRHTGKGALPWPANVERFDDPASLEIIPDWERVRDLARSDPDVRREWSWLFLPIRWGYPAVPSPLAGVVGHAETGNLSPPGPAYNGGWNRTGAAGGFERYDPNRYSSLFPLSPVDAFQNDFGFLNAPVVVFTVLPPFDLLYRLVWRPLRALIGPAPSPVFLPAAPVQRRIVGISVGVFVNALPSSVGAAFVNSAQLPDIDRHLAAAGISGPVTTSTTADTAPYPSFQVQFYLTPRLVSQNTFRYSRNTIDVAVLPTSASGAATLSGSLQMYEYAGSVRFNLLTGRIQPFLKAGYGYSWYRLQGVTVDGQKIDPPSSPFLHRPSFWPNTFHYGIGIEANLTETEAPFTGVGIGLKLESNVFTHSLGLALHDNARLGLVADASVTRPNVDLALVLSF
ncbi:outer membrane protein [Anaeromyxobacter oryzae]|uniref:Bacterial surface antigen (D15) domain-containing protein n=1 Tax=Anaeromyxobacter oryzae TaxID=2918170 RepID=A0ABM7WRE6_9BACT|nr:hypothetical protein [Anaeromyxobacter oryzae]BDG02044.1 hypothetical protein AMOR_10400 [Anaeromyxobacter oryzae]